MESTETIENKPLTIEDAVSGLISPEITGEATETVEEETQATEEETIEASDENAEVEELTAESDTEEVEASDEDGEEIEMEASSEDEIDNDYEEDAVQEEVSDTYSVKVNGQVKEVTLDELKQGYSGQEYVQQGMQDNAKMKKEVEGVYQALQNERQDLPKFTASLVQLRRTLEENKLNLKSETKEKTIEQINEIFESKEIQNDIEKLNEINDKIKQIKEKIKTAGLADKLENIKNEISINSVKLEHTQTDLERRNKDYNRYLNSLKEERESFQELASQVLEEPVKLTITFGFRSRLLI